MKKKYPYKIPQSIDVYLKVEVTETNAALIVATEKMFEPKLVSCIFDVKTQVAECFKP